MKNDKLANDEKFDKQDFDLFEALDSIDNKKYDWYKTLSDEQKKKFNAYMLLNWLTFVKSNNVAAYYVLSAEHHTNKYFFNEKIQNHDELQWLMLCASSPNIGKQFRQWIPNLNVKIKQLKTSAKYKDVYEYFSKIYKDKNNDLLKEISTNFVDQQNLKYRIAKKYPNMKLDDIDTLINFISNDDLNKHDELSGN